MDITIPFLLCVLFFAIGVYTGKNYNRLTKE